MMIVIIVGDDWMGSRDGWRRREPSWLDLIDIVVFTAHAPA